MRRSTIILLSIFLLLGALVWVMQQPDNLLTKAFSPITPIPSPTLNPLITPEKGPISWISIQDASNQSISLERISSQWLVTSNNNAPADQNLAESAAGQAFNLRIIKQLETAPAPAGTGLDNPLYTISLKLADKPLFTFKIGKATITDSGYYCETSDGAVYILSKNEVDTLINNFVVFSANPITGETESPIPDVSTSNP